MRSNEHLTSAEIYFEAGIPYIKLEYEYENDEGTHKIVFPKVEFPFSCLSVPTINTIDERYYISSRSVMDFRPSVFGLLNGDAKILADDRAIFEHNVVFLDAIIKKNVREMTLEEIEKKLGYSVKIVTKESKND